MSVPLVGINLYICWERRFASKWQMLDYSKWRIPDYCNKCSVTVSGKADGVAVCPQINECCLSLHVWLDVKVAFHTFIVTCSNRMACDWCVSCNRCRCDLHTLRLLWTTLSLRNHITCGCTCTSILSVVLTSETFNCKIELVSYNNLHERLVVCTILRTLPFSIALT